MHVLLNPAPDVKGFSTEDWNTLLVTSRNEQMLGYVAHKLDNELGLENLPASVARHFRSRQVVFDNFIVGCNRHIETIQRVLRQIECEPLFLKGIAYQLRQLPFAQGRLTNDLDILVPKNRIDEAYSALQEAGWKPVDYDEYDEKYFREWMHEFPPLTHKETGAVIDLHHNILPPISKYQVKAEVLLEATEMVTRDDDEFLVLSPDDTLLHAIAHLFNEVRFDRNFRDLYDLYQQFSYFLNDSEGNWYRFFERAEQLKLTKLAFLAIRYCMTQFSLSLPVAALTHYEKLENQYHTFGYDLIYKPIFTPVAANFAPLTRRVATFFAYMRGHYIKMPLRILIPHLQHKWFKRNVKKKIG